MLLESAMLSILSYMWMDMGDGVADGVGEERVVQLNFSLNLVDPLRQRRQERGNERRRDLGVGEARGA